MLTHPPSRPGWACAACPDPDTPWPCDRAREELAGRGWDLVTLTTYMSELMLVAGPELGCSVTPAELYERFLGWPRQALTR